MSFNIVNLQHQEGTSNGAEKEMTHNADVLKKDGIPLIFHIPPNDSSRHKYSNIINRHGGIVAETLPNGTNGIILLSSRYINNPNAYKLDLVDDSISGGKLVNIEDYKYFENDMTKTDKHPNRIKNRMSNRFTKEQDEYLLEQIRLNPAKRGSHAFYEQLLKHPILEDHTKHSLRSRFRLYLVKKMDYAYKTDDRGELLYDKSGNRVKIPLDVLPDVKRKYTADDDYILCKEIVAFNTNRLHESQTNPGRVELDNENLNVPVSFFTQIMKAYPNHSAQSWRDRYRKFAVDFGILDYISYYEQETANNRIPQPLSRKNKLTKHTDMVRNLVGSNYDDNSRALDEEIGEIKNSNIDDALKNTVQPISVPQLSTLPDEIQSDTSSRMEDDAPPSQTGSLQSYIHEMENPVEPSSNNQTSNINSRTESNIMGVDDDSQSSFEGSDSQSDVEFEYLSPDAKAIELFDSTFFNKSLEEKESEITQIITESEGKGLPRIKKKFLSIGLKLKLINHILITTGCNSPFIQKYISLWIYNLDEKAFNNIYSTLRIEGERGIWIEEYDEKLKSKLGIKEMQRLHGKPFVNHRIEFLKGIRSI